MKTLLKLLAVLIALCIIAGAVVALFGEKMAQAYLEPPKEFAAIEGPSQPDYSRLDGWAAHPDKIDTADILRNGETAVPNSLRDVDVFYVHPTTYLGPGEWNTLAGPDNAAGQGVEPVLAVHGTVFRDCCRIYIPRYRQAHIRAFTKYDSEDSFKALDLAYADVEAAFETFIKDHNQGRPFIIAGHSQGSLHAVRLLENKIQGTPLADRMVAAYPIGYWIPEDKLDRGLAETGLCQAPDQTGCFVTFDTYGEPGGGRDHDGRLPWWYASGWEWVQPEKTLCVNPLSWTPTEDRVAETAHLGAVTNRPYFSVAAVLQNKHSGITFDSIPEAIPELTWAQCLPDGSLLIADQSEGPFAEVINTTSHMYHSYDWSLFYENIKDNVENRITHYFGEAGKNPSPDPAVIHANEIGDAANPYSEGYFEYEGHRLHYVEAGEGLLVILYHGYPTNWYSYFDQMEGLKSDYRVVAVDALGSGLSDAPQSIEPYRLENLTAHLNALSKKLNGDEKFVLIGHDWGAALAWGFAQKYPERLHKVIGMSAPPPNVFLELLVSNEKQREISAYTQRTHDLDIATIRETNLADYTWKNSYRRLVAENRITPEENAIYKTAIPNAERQNAALNWYRANVPLYEHIQDEDFWPSRDARITVPALLIWGDRDPLFVPEFIDLVSQLASDLTVERISHVSHWTPMEDPEPVTRVIKDFINGN